MTCKVSEYRRQAEELRSAADATDHQITRDTLLKFAEEFDRMALHPLENHPKVLKWWRIPQNSH
jgi:hypothetical protein